MSPAHTLEGLIYWSGDGSISASIDEDTERPGDSSETAEGESQPVAAQVNERESMYVTLFESRS
jgi:hypothetical protein